MDFIRLKESDSILRFEILDSEGKDTGEYLEFDLEDIELPLRLAEAEDRHYANRKKIKSQMIIIDKEQDENGNGTLTKNQKKKYEAMREYYKEEEKALDLFLGEGGTAKLLNGRKPFFTMYDYINDLLKPVFPKIYEAADKIFKNIKDKYKADEIEEGVLNIDD